MRPRLILLAATLVAFAGPAIAQSQLYLQAQRQVNRAGLNIDIPPDATVGQLWGTIRAIEEGGRNKTQLKIQVQSALGLIPPGGRAQN